MCAVLKESWSSWHKNGKEKSKPASVSVMSGLAATSPCPSDTLSRHDAIYHDVMEWEIPDQRQTDEGTVKAKL